MLPKESLDIILNLFNYIVTQSYKSNRKQPIT